ncbi:MAG: hypothetical protein WA191_06055 [Telluria sp.]
MLQTEIYTNQIPTLYAQFAVEIGDSHWRRRTMLLDREIKGNRFLREYLHAENSIAYELEALREHIAKFGPTGLPAIGLSCYGAARFAAQTISIITNLPPKVAAQFRRRVQGAFQNPDDMRGLQVELAIATHFVRQGRRVTWPELDGTGTYDMYVNGLGPNGLAIECKAISEDKGRRVHKRDALEFHALLEPLLVPITTGLSTGLVGVLTVPARLPTNCKDRVQLAKQFAQHILGNRSTTLSDGSRIAVKQFDMSEFGYLPSINKRAARSAIDTVTGTANRESMTIGTNAGGALVLTVQSASDDLLMKTTFDTLSDAARRQLPHTHAGILLAGFAGLSHDQLASIAGQDFDQSQNPTNLRVHASKFLGGQNRDHVVGVGFLTASDFSRERNGIIDSAGAAYYFGRRESPFWSDDYSGMFGEIG